MISKKKKKKKKVLKSDFVAADEGFWESDSNQCWVLVKG